MKKSFGVAGAAEVRGLKQSEDENLKVKRPVADLRPDKAILQQVVRERV